MCAPLGSCAVAVIEARSVPAVLADRGTDLLPVSQQMTSLLQLERNTIAELDQGIRPETSTRVRVTV